MSNIKIGNKLYELKYMNFSKLNFSNTDFYKSYTVVGHNSFKWYGTSFERDINSELLYIKATTEWRKLEQHNQKKCLVRYHLLT